jgi:hypothetical protein
MILIKYLDIYDSYYDEEGNRNDVLLEQNHTVPFYINKHEILNVSPYFGRNGKLFKNVSIINDRYGASYKVVGNYKTIINEKENKLATGTIGYGKTTN